VAAATRPRPEERAILRDLRGVLTGDPHPDRERLARYATAYLRSYLLASSPHWRFGFHDDPEDVASAAAHVAVAWLMERREGLQGPLPRLRRILLASLSDLEREEDTSDVAPGTDVGARCLGSEGDSEGSRLLAAFRRVLRRQGRQELHRVWKREHPQQARLLRAIKSSLARTAREGEVLPPGCDGNLRIVRDARGQFVVGPFSDLRLPPLSRSDIEALVGRLTNAFSEIADLLAALRGAFHPQGRHGGYAYLMDLVRVLHDRRLRLLAADPLGTGAVPGSLEIWTSREGLPGNLWVTRWREALRERAMRILETQEEKRRRASPGREPSPRWLLEAQTEAAVEMTARGYGFGKPEWSGLGQRRILERLLPAHVSPETWGRILQETDYCVRCLRKDLGLGRIRAAVPARPLEQREKG
jgi:hypothetical protein